MSGALAESPLVSRALFHLGPVPVSSAVLTTWGLLLVLAGASGWLSTRIVVEKPGRLQALAEWLLEVIDAQIRDATQLDPQPHRPLIATLFLFILGANLSSLIPGVEPPTARIETDAALALIVFVAAVHFGIRRHGVIGYLRHFAEPTWVMIPLNLVEQVTRTFSLMLRLFGNVMAGVFVVGIVLSLAGLLVPIPFMALDVLTGVVQAYIFSVLATVFIGATAGASSSHGSQEKP